jgi:hypothetical protein
MKRINKNLYNCKLSGDPGGIRTHDPRLKRQLLYQLSYRIKERLMITKTIECVKHQMY